MNTIARLLATALFGLTGTMAAAEIEFCNRTEDAVQLALVYEGDQTWHSRGWFDLEAHSCNTVRSGFYGTRYFYYRAQDYDGNFLNGYFEFCIRDGRYEHDDALEGCTDGYDYFRGFKLIDTQPGGQSIVPMVNIIREYRPDRTDRSVRSALNLGAVPSGLVPGDHGPSFRKLVTFQGCGMNYQDWNSRYCEFMEPDGTILEAEGNHPTPALIFDSLKSLPVGEAVYLEADLIETNGRLHKKIAITSYKPTQDRLPFGHVLEKLQGRWRSLDGDGEYSSEFVGAILKDFKYDTQQIAWFLEFTDHCEGHPVEAEVYFVQKDPGGRYPDYCLALVELSDERHVIALPKSGARHVYVRD